MGLNSEGNLQSSNGLSESSSGPWPSPTPPQKDTALDPMPPAVLLPEPLQPTVAYFDAAVGVVLDAKQELVLWNDAAVSARPGNVLQFSGSCSLAPQDEAASGGPACPAVRFDGVTGQAVMGDGLLPGWDDSREGAFTAVWIGRLSCVMREQTLLSLSRTQADYDDELWWTNRDVVAYSHADGYGFFLEPPSLAPNQWTMQVLCRDSLLRKVSMYGYDGAAGGLTAVPQERCSMKGTTTPCSIRPDNLALGADIRLGDKFLAGDVAVVLLYNRALGRKELQGLVNHYSARFGWQPLPVPKEQLVMSPSTDALLELKDSAQGCNGSFNILAMGGGAKMQELNPGHVNFNSIAGGTRANKSGRVTAVLQAIFGRSPRQGSPSHQKWVQIRTEALKRARYKLEGQGQDMHLYQTLPAWVTAAEVEVEGSRDPIFRCVNVLDATRDSNGVVHFDKLLEIPADTAKPTRPPKPEVACHIPVSCEDPVSLFFLAVADWRTGLVALLAALMVWTFIGLFFYWLTTQQSSAVMPFRGTSLEFTLIIIAYIFQVVYILFEVFFKPARNMWTLSRLIAKVQPGQRFWMFVVWGLVLLDLLQPFCMVAVSVYVSFFFSGSGLIGVIQSVAAMAFIATLDNLALKQYVEWMYGSEYRISLAFLDIQYNARIQKPPLDSLLRNAKVCQQDLLNILHSEGATLQQKWEALTSTSAGFGLVGDIPTDREVPQNVGCSFGKTAAVLAVVLDVSFFSWDALKLVHSRQQQQLEEEKKQQEEKERTAIKAVKWDMHRVRWYLAGASELQWKYELDEHYRTTLLKHCPEHVERFSFSFKGPVCSFQGRKLGDADVRVVARMLRHSPGVTTLDLSGNQGIWDGGTARLLAEAVRVNDSLTKLVLKQTGLPESDARFLMAALKAKPNRPGGKSLDIMGNGISRECIREMLQRRGDVLLSADV